MQYLHSDDLPLNKAVLDAWNTGRIFVDLHRQFYPVEFFDLCTIVEQIVLRDEIILVGKFERLPASYRAALRPFIDAGVFKICIDAFPIEKHLAIDPGLRSLAQQTRLTRLTSTTLQDCDYAVTRLLGAEIHLRVPTVPLLQHLHNYQFFRRPVLDNTVCDLAARYTDVAKRLQVVKSHDFRRCALKPLPIPPIALQILQRAHSYEKLREQVLQARHQYRQLRNAMRELAEIFGNPSLDSAKYYQLVEQWEQRWLQLAQFTVPSLMQIGTSAAPLLAGGKELASAYKSGTTIGTVITGLNLLNAAGRAFGSLTLRPVHLSVNNYLRTHPRAMIAAVSQTFKIEGGEAKRLMEAVAGPTSNVWRAALERLR